jgi:very-short-patch-repair endonuclease
MEKSNLLHFYFKDLIVKKLTTEEFIERAKKVHGSRYDYSKVNYINSTTKVCIICSEHGEFYNTPGNHIFQKQGCSSCYGNKKATTEEFIEKAKKVHGNKYDYSKVNYINNYTKVCIICPKHEEFNQKAYNHTRGDGCPICKTSKGELKIINILEKNNIKYLYQHKFKECKNKLPLPFDFYLPEHNLLIEYDGRQHFEQSGFSNDKLKKTQKHDKIKNNFCKEKGINLLRIPFWKKEEIEDIVYATIN